MKVKARRRRSRSTRCAPGARAEPRRCALVLRGCASIAARPTGRRHRRRRVGGLHRRRPVRNETSRRWREPTGRRDQGLDDRGLNRGARTFAAGQRVVIPRRPWNPAAWSRPASTRADPRLPQPRPAIEGRRHARQRPFAEQMRYSSAKATAWCRWRSSSSAAAQAQLPRKSVVLTFDDGYHSFRDYAIPC